MCSCPCRPGGNPDAVTLGPVLDQLPPVGDRRLAVRVTKDAVRQIRGGHPWVYESSVVSVSDGGVTGDLAVIFDDRRAFVAIGLYDPSSAIRVRVLHVGRPATIDRSWWTSALDTARRRRAPLTEGPDAAHLGYRVLNGENDAMPGLVLDLYSDVAVIKLYTSSWIRHLPDVLAAVVSTLQPTSTVLRLARNVAAGDTFGLDDGDVIDGPLVDGPVMFTENGLWFEADVRSGQKTGFFLDQRANHRQVGRLVRGRTVLDVFSATGGFSVHAAAGGAVSVHSVDQSEPTLAGARRNMAHNRARPAVAACDHTTEAGDAFKVMVALGRAGRTFDTVVVDPPSFARRNEDVRGAVRAYTRLTHLALRLVRPGGHLVQASCSSRVSASDFYAAVLDAATDAGRELREIARTGHDIDHPVTFPEGAYLKAGFWHVRD